MVPLLVMVVACIAVRMAGIVGLTAKIDSWTEALPFALAAMFMFTAASHFVPRLRTDLMRMVPPSLPWPALLVTVTGVFETLGAVRLLLSGLVQPAAYALIALLVAMFPANVHAARARLSIAGRRAPPLALRLPLQLVWIAMLWWAGRHQT